MFSPVKSIIPHVFAASVVIAVLSTMPVASAVRMFSDVMGRPVALDSGSRMPPPAGAVGAISLPVLDEDGVSHPKNLFKEYMTRGLYQCTSKYVHILSKLHALIKEAYEEYAACELQLKDNTQRRSTEVALLDQFLSEMDDEEEEVQHEDAVEQAAGHVDGPHDEFPEAARRPVEKRSSLSRFSRSVGNPAKSSYRRREID